MIYALSPDTAHIDEEDVYDANLIEFERFADARFFNPGFDYHAWCGAPEVIEFVGNLENAGRLDHIFTAPMGLLLISRRMVTTLESVAPFRHRLIPTRIYAESVGHLVRDLHTRRRTAYDVRDPTLRNEDFVILQLEETLDCLDHDRTIVAGAPFRESSEEYLGMEEADHLELHRPEGGFPPVFFVPELLFYCFSEEAKRACDMNDLRGLWWRPQR